MTRSVLSVRATKKAHSESRRHDEECVECVACVECESTRKR